MSGLIPCATAEEDCHKANCTVHSNGTIVGKLDSSKKRSLLAGTRVASHTPEGHAKKVECKTSFHSHLHSPK